MFKESFVGGGVIDAGANFHSKDSGTEKIASSLTGILEKTSDLKSNMKDGVDSIVDKASEFKPNIKDGLESIGEKASEFKPILKDRMESIGEKVSEFKPNIKDRMDTIVEKASDLKPNIRDKMDSIGEKVSEFKPNLKDRLESIGEKASEFKPNVKDRLDSIAEKIGSIKPNLDNIPMPKNYLQNLSGLRKMHAIQLGGCLKDISGTMHDELSSAKDKISFGNIFQLKPTRKLFDKLLDLLKEKANERKTRREAIISKIDVKPIFDEFLNECSKIVTVTDKLRDKIDSRTDKIASTLTGILEKTSNVGSNMKDKMGSIVDKVGSNKPNFEHGGNGGKFSGIKHDEYEFDYFDSDV